MRKFLFMLLPLLLFVTPVKASIEEWETQKQTIQQERSKLKEQIKQKDIELNSIPVEAKEERATKTKEKMLLVIEDNKKAAYEEAYIKAIEYETGGSAAPGEGQHVHAFPFVPVSLLPGETAPPQYIPLYKEAGERYGVDWFVLASIHKIETSYSRIPLMVSSVGAQGHFQFMPGTFAAYGVDGDGDGQRSPWDLEDACFSAANYLSKSGYKKDIRKAIWHYNHAEWYVNDVLETAAQIRSAVGGM
jgi:membrane-bound lytic murein transglycosylase B